MSRNLSRKNCSSYTRENKLVKKLVKEKLLVCTGLYALPFARIVSFLLYTQTNNTLALARNTRLYTWAAYQNRELIRFYGSRALTLYSEDVINDPQKVLKKLCTFLDVVCTEDYLKDCASIIYRNPSKTRTAIAWTPKLKQDVENVIKSISFLNRYTFDS